MKNYIAVFLVICTFSLAKSQYYCNPKPKKFKEYKLGIYSDQGGLYSNAYTIQQNSIQIESSLSHGYYVIKGNSNSIKLDSFAFANATQLRYGLSSGLELKLGYTYVYPPNIEADTGTHSQVMIGFKFKLLSVTRRNIKWNAALAGNYFIENPASGAPVFPGGYYAMLNNSLKLFKVINLDTMFGLVHNLNRNSMLGLLSAQLYIKSDESGMGFFAGIGGVYIESYVNAGILITDNYNYIMHFSLMSMDNTVALNVSCTFCFNQ